MCIKFRGTRIDSYAVVRCFCDIRYSNIWDNGMRNIKVPIWVFELFELNVDHNYVGHKTSNLTVMYRYKIFIISLKV